ncbi:hypothetical protein GBN26_11820 [Plesiomonas shigelloides]|uniref:hypothetical protein n=1 Tax=Plesiomonas shigelloides TaxID=703 RepID=UPI001261C6EA|nr:hypothetical protein [Plesiomonas shigelloides]KAB7698935.1 hypothetical protein GBN26_11820 [Plesiomonas shigelloides]
MKLYLVDRLSSYYPGYEVKLQKIIYPEVNDVTILLDSLFPHGLSRHGVEHFLNTNAHITIKEVNIEWAAEFYRRAMCPNKPSRMTSIFACGTIDDARRC